jgi:hypothetical protein
MRGGCVRRSRRESCQAHKALPARLREQKSLVRASVRAFHEAEKEGEGGICAAADASPLTDEDEHREPAAGFASSFSSSRIRSRADSFMSSSSRTLLRKYRSSSSLERFGRGPAGTAVVGVMVIEPRLGGNCANWGIIKGPEGVVAVRVAG